MEYNVVARTTIPALNEVVNNMLDEGWNPYGSIAVIHDEFGSGSILFIQPLIRYTYTIEALSTDYEVSRKVEIEQHNDELISAFTASANIIP